MVLPKPSAHLNVPQTSGHFCVPASVTFQVHEPPLVDQGRIFATQPGMWEIESMELETGRLRWSQAVPELSCVSGLLEERLIVETADEVAALDAKTGRVVWRRQLGRRLDARLCSKPGGILVVEVESVEQPRGFRPVLVWLDPESGEVKKEGKPSRHNPAGAAWDGGTLWLSFPGDNRIEPL